MLIHALSDQHGTLPEVEACDLLLIGGDVCPMDNHDPTYQWEWLDTEYREWLESIDAKHIVGVAGNHDFVAEEPFPELPDLPWHYLQDSEVMVEGLKIYGHPWVPNLPGWAFYGDDAKLQEATDAIPDDVDILITHGPPAGIGDEISWAGHVGDPHLASALQYRLKPKLHIFGHIHEGRGRWEWENGRHIAANVAILDQHYNPYPLDFEEFEL